MKEIKNTCTRCGHIWYIDYPETFAEKLKAFGERMSKSGSRMFRSGFNLIHGIIFPPQEKKFETTHCPKCNSRNISNEIVD